MLEKELLYEYALKAMERFESKKISIFGNGYIESLDDSGRFVDRDLSKEKDYETWALNSIEEGNGIFIVMGQFVIDYCGSFEDITDTDFVFDDRYYEEGHLESLYREYYGLDDEDMYDEPVDEEDYDFENEPEAVSFYIDAEHSVSAACSVDYFPPITDFICHVGINVCKDGDEYLITPGYAYLPDVGAFDPRMTYEDWPITKESIEDDPVDQLLAIVLDSNLHYEGEEDIENGLESLLKIIKKEPKRIKKKKKKEGEELLKSGKISSYLEHFEELNVTTDSIYDLEDNEVLIILKDGSNLTSWGDVDNREDILYLSEDLSNCTNLSEKYLYLTSLKSIVAFGVTDNVTNMEKMFQGCSSLIELVGFDEWKTSNVTNMSQIFYNCHSLADLSYLSKWDTSNVTNMEQMFSDCSSLVDLSPLADWDISQVSSMKDMFQNCDSLVDLSPLANWDTSKVSLMYGMFCYCSSLVDLSPLANWDTSSFYDLDYMFCGCSELKDLSPLGSWDISNVLSLRSMFKGCSELKDLSPLGGWDISNVSYLNNMFYGCSALEDISSLANWDTSNIRDMPFLFYNCSSLVDLSPLSGWNTSNVVVMHGVFLGCSALEDISPLRDWNTSNVAFIDSMFSGCTSLSDLSPLDNWDVSNVFHVKLLVKRPDKFDKYPSWYK